jgi:hypothetical protein
VDDFEYLGRPQGRKRWRSLDRKRYYEYDGQHVELEVYTSRGRHLGAADVVKGELYKLPERTRRIDV